MELTLIDAEFRWFPQQEEDAAKLPLPEEMRVAVHLPASGDVEAQELSLPYTLRVTTSKAGEQKEGSGTAGTRPFVLKVLDGTHLLTSSRLKVEDFVPPLTEGRLSIVRDVVVSNVKATLQVIVRTKTDRRPRELVNKGLVVWQRAAAIAHQLSLHKNKVAVGLLTPVLGTLLGLVATSPLWLPLTLLVGIMGFPLWFVIGVAAALVLVFAAMSALVAVQVVRSARVKAAVDGFLRSPQGQLVLFQGTESNQRLAPGEVAARVQQYVMENPSHKLLASLAIDFVGSATFAVPVVGELADLFWAPVSAKLVSAMYSESSPRMHYLAFLEEFLPFTDVIPTATLAWMKENLSFFRKNPSSAAT